MIGRRKLANIEFDENLYKLELKKQNIANKIKEKGKNLLI
jgi:hypothetical protein